jgi:hypothetical protein
MLVHGVGESVRRWRTVDGVKKPEDITTKPLPDPEELNRTTPQSEWERQLDGNMGAGWKHEVFIYLVNLATGERYSYSNHTAGAHIAWDLLKEAVITMRALRGNKCYPLVNLTERPMKSKYRPGGMGMRPHFEIIDWKTPGAPSAVSEQLPPQLPSPSNAPADSVTPEPAVDPTPLAPAPAPAPAPPAAAQPQPRKTKRPIAVSEYTAAVMGSPKPITTAELLNDSLDDLPWDQQ